MAPPVAMSLRIPGLLDSGLLDVLALLDHGLIHIPGPSRSWALYIQTPLELGSQLMP